MGTAITVYSEQLPADLTEALANARDERSIPSEHYALIAKFAEAPPPALLPASQDEIREIIGFLAGALKHQSHGEKEGQLKLAAYFRALRDLPLAAVQHAADRAIKESDWMPGQATLRKYAQEFRHPALLAHGKARNLVQQRRQRQWKQLMADLKAKKIPEDRLPDLKLDEEDIERLRMNRLLIEVDGILRYWTADLESQVLQARRVVTQTIIAEVAAEYERHNTHEGDQNGSEKGE